jgi:hypothetical protein
MDLVRTRSRRILVVVAVAVLVPAVLAATGDAARERTYAPKDCTKPQVRPNRIVFACGDFGLYANHLRWKKWGHRRARGRGTLHANSCDPSCSAGNFDKYRVHVQLRKVRRRFCGDRYVRLFRKAILNFPDGKPSYAHRIHRTGLYCVPH